MEQINLTARQRGETGKCPARRLRSSGGVPGVLYGPAIKGSIPLTLTLKELDRVLHTAAGGNVLVNLAMEGDKKPRTVMFKQVSRHPLRGSVEHVDLIEVLMDKKVTVEVPVHITGKAAGAAFGGIVQQESRKVRIECLPSAIPDSIDLDVTPLGIGQSLHVRDIRLPEGVRAIDEPSMTIVSIVAPTAEVAPKTAEEVEAELAKSFEEKEEPKKEKAEE
jgi:large subunit ribosomal protein L25